MDSDLVSIPFWLASLARCVHPMSCQIVRCPAINEPESSAKSGHRKIECQWMANFWEAAVNIQSTNVQARISVCRSHERENLRAFLYEIGQAAATSSSISRRQRKNHKKIEFQLNYERDLVERPEMDWWEGGDLVRDDDEGEEEEKACNGGRGGRGARRWPEPAIHCVNVCNCRWSADFLPILINATRWID